MTFFRTIAVAAGLAAVMLAAMPTLACDSNYPWLCPPVPSIDSPPTSAQTDKGAQDAGKITARRAAAGAKSGASEAGKSSDKAAKAADKAERPAVPGRKRLARKSPPRQWAAKAHHAKIIAARRSDGDAAAMAITESMGLAPSELRERAPDPAGSLTMAQGDGKGAFATLWAERSAGAKEPVRAASASRETEAAALPGVQVASQNEVNEPDLAAPEPAASDHSWLRGLFLVFGGILALGSALRLLL